MTVEIYTTQRCGYCLRAKQLLKDKDAAFREIPVDDEPERRREMEERAGARTVPQIFIDGEHVGGFDELWELEVEDELDSMLERA